jgi:hypothetical protein
MRSRSVPRPGPYSRSIGVLPLATTQLPDALARRHLLEGTLENDKALALGEAYLEQEREVEAVDFLARAGATDALASLRDQAAARGDVFLIRIVCRALQEEPSSAFWEAVAGAASAAGRQHDAETAQRLATVGG